MRVLLYKWLFPMRVLLYKWLFPRELFLYKWSNPCKKRFSISGLICAVRDDVLRPTPKSAQEWNTLLYPRFVLNCDVKYGIDDSEQLYCNIESLN